MLVEEGSRVESFMSWAWKGRRAGSGTGCREVCFTCHINLTELTDAPVTCKTLFLGVSGSLFLEEISI